MLPLYPGFTESRCTEENRKSRQKHKLDSQNIHRDPGIMDQRNILGGLAICPPVSITACPVAERTQFCPSASRVPTDRIMVVVECGLRGVPEEKAELAWTKLLVPLQKRDHPQQIYSARSARPSKSLQEDDCILVLPADKGRATVVMDI